jgi:uncharacterized RDD family membrane protein YckC
MKIKRLATPPDSLRGHPAGFVTRYIAFLLDVLVVAIASLLFITILRVTLNFFGISNLLTAVSGPQATEPEIIMRSGAVRWLGTIAGGFLTFGIYSIVAWLLVGKTVGKALMGLRVLGQDGRRLTFRQALVRALSYYVSGLALFIGFLWVLVDDRRQAWHDKLARTLVVYEWDAKYEERLVNRVQTLDRSNQRRLAAQEAAVRLAAEGDEGSPPLGE